MPSQNIREGQPATWHTFDRVPTGKVDKKGKPIEAKVPKQVTVLISRINPPKTISGPDGHCTIHTAEVEFPRPNTNTPIIKTTALVSDLKPQMAAA